MHALHEKLRFVIKFSALFLNKIALENIDFHSALNFYGETTQTRRTKVSDRLQHVAISKRRFRCEFSSQSEEQ